MAIGRFGSGDSDDYLIDELLADRSMAFSCADEVEEVRKERDQMFEEGFDREEVTLEIVQRRVQEKK